jgi:hypothetical protein
MSLCPSLTAGGHGTVVMTRHYVAPHTGPAGDYIVVDHADAHVTVSDDLLHEVIEGTALKLGVRLEPPAGAPPPVPWAEWHDHELDAQPWPCQPYLVQPDRRYRCWHNWLLRIEGRNRTVVYRISTYDLATNAWRASWPD